MRAGRLKCLLVRNDNGRPFSSPGQLVLDAGRISTVTLDLDDTLWAIGPVIARAERRLRDWLDANYPRVTRELTHDDVLELRAQAFTEHADKMHDMTFLRREIIANMGRAAGCAIDVDAAFQVFFEARNDLELYPDVRPALSSLAERFTLIAVTNGNADLDRIGIGDLFAGLVSAQSAGAAKPSPAIFAAAVEMGGAAAARTLHVGDHPELDIDGARAAGLRTVWINRTGSEWPARVARPDGVIRTLHELLEMLEPR